jgi:UDP-sugar diphosphatase
MIKNIEITTLDNPKFVKPALMQYEQNGEKKSWELVEVHDSVSILLADLEKKCFIIVKQFRPPVYLSNKDGFTYELCAGIVDKQCSLKQIAKEEIIEECGYDVALDNIDKITSFYTSVGFGGSKQTLYYAQVDQSMKKSEGGGVELENIEVIELPFSDANDFILNEKFAKTPGIMYAFMWFFQEINPSFIS